MAQEQEKLAVYTHSGREKDPWLNYLRQALEQGGVRVEVCDPETVLIDRMRDRRFRGVILDGSVDQFDSLVQRLRGEMPEIPILVARDAWDTEDIRRAFRAGCTDILKKNHQVDQELTRRLQQSGILPRNPRGR